MKSALLAVTAVFGLVMSTHAQASLPTASEVISRLDQDHDGTLSWAEVQPGALAEFAKLDTDHDGTVDAKEWKAGGFTARQWKAAKPGKDGTLNQAEYLSWTKKQFSVADPDKDGTVSTAELSARRAKTLLQILQ